MRVLQMMASVAVLWVASVSASTAGPCSAGIDAMQSRVDARLEANAAAGPTAKEGVAATTDVQPTPRSIAAAEERLGEVSPQMVEAIGQAMQRARAADGAGDKSACEQALADAQRALGPSPGTKPR
jgi:mRNA-degrading endonuclease toxin of MazEF toxin-antitoxin module